MEQLISDIRYACRTFVRNPAFTTVAVLSLALGIGVNVVIFSVVNTALEKPIGGVARAGQLMRVYSGSHSPLSYQDFRYFRDSVRSFDAMVAERLQGVTTDRGDERRVRTHSGPQPPVLDARPGRRPDTHRQDHPAQR
jgi:hypothetical protein